MIVLNRPPTQDEMQYASDIIHGRRKWDVRIIVGFALLGAILGILVGFSSAQANNEPIDIGFTLICAGFCAAALGMAAALIMNAIRTIGAMCKAWLPARILTIAAGVLVLVQIAKKTTYWMIFPSQFVTDAVMGGLFLIFAVLFFMLGLRLLFILYCMITGKDEDEIMVRNIAAKNKNTTKKQ